MSAVQIRLHCTAFHTASSLGDSQGGSQAGRPGSDSVHGPRGCRRAGRAGSVADSEPRSLGPGPADPALQPVPAARPDLSHNQESENIKALFPCPFAPSRPVARAVHCVFLDALNFFV